MNIFVYLLVLFVQQYTYSIHYHQTDFCGHFEHVVHWSWKSKKKTEWRWKCYFGCWFISKEWSSPECYKITVGIIRVRLIQTWNCLLPIWINGNKPAIQSILDKINYNMASPQKQYAICESHGTGKISKYPELIMQLIASLWQRAF